MLPASDCLKRASEAQVHHHLGLRRLLELTHKEKVRYLGKSMDLDHTMCLQYAPVDRCENLRKELVFAVSWSLVEDFCRRGSRLAAV